jgi:hypothetical protein
MAGKQAQGSTRFRVGLQVELPTVLELESRPLEAAWHRL